MFRSGVESTRTKAVTGYVLFCTLALLLSCSTARAQDPSEADKLFSPSASARFREIAYDLSKAENVTGQQTEEALIFLKAAMNLSRQPSEILPDIIRIAARDLALDHYELVNESLANYAVGPSVDLEVVRVALSYMLDRLNSREERETILEEMLASLGSGNKVVGSELATLLGLLKTEKSDLEAATYYLTQAYNNNRYNRLAFEKLAEIMPTQIGPSTYLEQMRLRLGMNPLDMQTALVFAQYAEKLQLYEVASDTYGYCAELFGYLYPFEALPASLYLPWAISSYNTPRSQYKCLAIASSLRRSGRFDLFLEAIAAKAAAKAGDQEQANQILKNIQDKAQKPADEAYETKAQISAEQLAWFYSFVLPDANQALDWANKAYSVDPNSPTATAILAYSLVMNDQTDLAKSLVETGQRNQIADLTLAQIQLANGQKDFAVKTLGSAIERDPGSLAAERAKELLGQLGAEYTPPVDPEMMLTALRDNLVQPLVPKFLSPDKAISFQVSLRSSKFFYSSELSGALVITNNSSEPLVVSDGGLFEGYIRVDAYISGDIDKRIPNLIRLTIRPASPVDPGQSILVPLRLMTGELRETLVTHPQASLNLGFTVYLDPVTTTDGAVGNRLSDLRPARVVVARPGVVLTNRYLQNRLSSLTKGRQVQKIRTAELFSGLLIEQHIMRNREPSYRFIYADWMPPLLKSAVVHNLADDDWVVRTCTMTGMHSLPLDYELTSAVAENLNASHWPCRLMAVYLIAKSPHPSFQRVLEWTATNDVSEFVGPMAAALASMKPEK